MKARPLNKTGHICWLLEGYECKNLITQIILDGYEGKTVLGPPGPKLNAPITV